MMKYSRQGTREWQMQNVKHVILEPGKKKFIYRHILHQNWYTRPISLLTRRNPQHISPLTCLSDFRISVERISRPSCEPLYATNTSQCTHETFLYEYSLHWVLLPTKKMHNRTLFFGITFLKHCHHSDYRDHSLNMGTHVSHLDCDEAGPCCYLVI
jgi:hypothetical protein